MTGRNEEGSAVGAVTAVGCEYVADERDLSVPGVYDVTDEDIGVALILEYLRERLRAVFDAWQRPPILMLSGGIDSILIAAVAASLREDAVAFTFQQANLADSVEESDIAARVAEELGLEHRVVDPVLPDFRRLVLDVLKQLDTSEPWEVLAGTVLLAIDRAARDRGLEGPIISGGGADALFLGGEQLISGGDEAAVLGEWDQRIRSKVRRNFIRERFIPDFYERLIGDANRHIQVWQTHAATDLALSLHPKVVRGGDLGRDKGILRRAARQLGLPEQVVSLKKNPMQVSAGGVDSIVAIARQELLEAYGEQTYSSPGTEPLEFVVARMWLRSQAG